MIVVGNRLPQFNRWRVRSAIAGATAAAVILVGVLHALILSPPRAQAYAFVSLDLNPSVSLALSDKMTVLEVDGLNQSGTALAHELHVTGDSLSTAIDQIVKQVADSGAFPSGDAIVVAASSALNPTAVSSIQQTAANDVNQALQDNSATLAKPPLVYSIGVPNDVWQQALKANVSPGKYATYLLATQAGVPVKLQDINSADFQVVLGQLHDLHAGLVQLDRGNVSQVQGIVEAATASQK